MTVPLSFASIVGLALTSSVFSTALGQGLIWWREVKTTKRELSYLALRIATSFERFAHDTLERLWAHGAYVNTDGEHGVWNRSLPELTALPDEKERWRDLDTRLTTRVLDFDPHRRVVQNKIDEAYEHIDDMDATRIMRSEWFRIGNKALDLALEIRERYDVQSSNVAPWQTFLRDEVGGPAVDGDDEP